MMHFWSRDAKRLIMVGVFGLVALLFMGCLFLAQAREQPQTSIQSICELQSVSPKWSGTLRLAEMVQRQDSVIMRTDPKDKNYEERQWEEREKEKQSWDMLKNMIIDGRQPPRRFSDPRANERPQ
jgi:hypothetical protein